MKIKILPAVLFIILSALPFHAQQVIKIDKASGDLPGQFQTAFNNGRTNGNFWVGYSIRRNDDYQFIVGSYSFNDKNNAVTLRDVIMNIAKFRSYNSQREKTKRKRIHRRSINISHGVSINNKGIDKETAILFHYDRTSKSIDDFAGIIVCNLSLYVDLENYPVLWLGEIDSKNSLDFLIDLYKKSKNSFPKEELVPAIGIHSDQPATTSFIKEIFYSKTGKDLHESSVFWFGFQNNKEAFAELKKIINNDKSLDIRNDAVMSLSYIQLPEATDELINIARHNNNSELRKHAIYGLGNKAVKLAENVLQNIIEDDPDIEIKKSAVYSLANTSGNMIPYLIKIAKTHPSLEIRKCAIYSLGNSDDERAVDALIAMAKNQ